MDERRRREEKYRKKGREREIVDKRRKLQEENKIKFV